MNKALILYFSGTRNTKYIAQMFKKAFEARNIQVDIYDILNYDAADNKTKYDYLVAGSPIYVELYPEIFITNIKKKVPKNNKLKAIFFATQAAKSLTPNFNEVYNYYKNSDVEITCTDFFRMPNNFYNFLFSKTPVSEYQSLLDNAAKKAELITDGFLSGSRNIKKVSNARYYFTKVMYMLSYKFYIPSAASKVSINSERCVKCKVCEKNCPTKSLDISSSAPVSKTCIMCQKCMNNCPQNAFMYKSKEFDIYTPVEL